MAKAADLRAIEEDVPWLRDDFSAGLEVLSGELDDEGSGPRHGHAPLPEQP